VGLALGEEYIDDGLVLFPHVNVGVLCDELVDRAICEEEFREDFGLICTTSSCFGTSVAPENVPSLKESVMATT